MDLGAWVSLEPEVVHAMLALGGVDNRTNHLDLGAGDGRFCTEAMVMGAKSSIGYELDPAIVAVAVAAGANVQLRDVGTLTAADVRQVNLITVWTTIEPVTTQLLGLLYERLRPGTRLVLLYDSRVQTRDGQRIEMGVPIHAWQPTEMQWVLGNKICLYVK